MTIMGVRRRNAAQLSLGQSLGHERELRALHGDWRAPQPQVLLPGQSQQRLSCRQGIADRLFAPYVLASCEALCVQFFVFLHVGQHDQEIERNTGEHLIDMGIVVRDPKTVSLDQDLEIMVAKGTLICRVKGKSTHGKKNL